MPINQDSFTQYSFLLAPDEWYQAIVSTISSKLGMKKKTFCSFHSSPSHLFHPASALEGQMIKRHQLHNQESIIQQAQVLNDEYSPQQPWCLIDLTLPQSYWSKSKGVGLIYSSAWETSSPSSHFLSSLVFFRSKEKDNDILWMARIQFVGAFFLPLLQEKKPNILSWKSQGPSRSQLKMKELLVLYPQLLISSPHIVEIGSAPGGITHFLLGQGLNVTSFDPAHINLPAHPNWIHHHIPFQDLSLKKNLLTPIISRPYFLVIDMNLDPTYIWNYLELTFFSSEKKPQGIFFVTKMTKNLTLKEIVFLKKKIDLYFVQSCYPLHLYWNKHELVLLAWRS